MRTPSGILLATALAAAVCGCKRPFPPNVTPPDVKPALGSAAAAPRAALAPAAAPVILPADAETAVGGVPVACTGVGQTKLDPRWEAYPVRVEVSNGRNEYLADAQIAVWDASGRSVLNVRCAGPWILLRPAQGAYRIEGRLPGLAAAPRTATFRPPAKGQMRLVLQFPDA
jgi:hypothetical protein